MPQSVYESLFLKPMPKFSSGEKNPAQQHLLFESCNSSRSTKKWYFSLHLMTWSLISKYNYSKMGLELLAVCFYMQFNTVVLIFQGSHGLGPVRPKDYPSQTYAHPFHSSPPCQMNCGWKETGKRSFLWFGSLLMEWSSRWSLHNIYVTIWKGFSWSQLFSCWQYTTNTPRL